MLLILVLVCMHGTGRCDPAGSPGSEGQGPKPGWETYDPGTLELGERPLVALPLTFVVAPNCYLYLHGKRVREVALTGGPSGKLFLNGEQIKGPGAHQPSEPQPYTEQEISLLYKDVPLIRRLVASGFTWNEAVGKWSTENERIWDLTRARFYDAIEAGAEPEKAAELAAAAGTEADTAGIFAPPGGIKVAGDGLCFNSTGYASTLWFPNRLYHRPDSGKAKPERKWTEEEVLARATYLYEHLSGQGTPAFIRLTNAGMASSIGARAVSEVLEQLQRARSDPSRCPPGRLASRELEDILEGEGILIEWEIP